MRLERNYCFSFPHPPFCFPLFALQLLLPPPLCLSSPPSVFLCSYFLVSPSSLSLPLAMTITLHQSSGPLYQLASLMPLQSSECLFLICSTHSDPPTSLRSPPSTLYLFVASLSLLLTSGLFPPWLLLVPFPCRKAYRQPWSWCRECMKLRDYKQLVEEEKIQTKCLRQILGNTKYSKVHTPLTWIFFTNNWCPYFSCQLLVSLTGLWSFLGQVTDMLYHKRSLTCFVMNWI